jgi:beta-glucosidase
LTTEQKVKLCEGANFWETKAFPEEDIPSVFICDGPHGIRKQEDQTDHLGVNKSRPATCFPTAVTTACSWDSALLGRIGEAISREAKDQGVGVFLGPGVNIKRNPLCGRNFEYFSEDPYLAGTLAANFIKQAQAGGIGVSLKHFACNNQEFKRFQSNSVLDERTLRELYLTAFEIAVREGGPKTVMCAYNKINGVYCSDNAELLTKILREEWGFDGLVVTDWSAMHDRIAGFKAGCDLNMPGRCEYMLEETLEAVESGELEESFLDKSAARVKKMARGAREAMENQTPCDYAAHHALAREAAEQGAVLLKNDGNLLPLNEGQTLAVVGDMAWDMRYQGAGSSHINPTRLVHPADVLKGTADVEDADAAIVFAGLPPEYESEGFDREHMKLPDSHVCLIEDTAGRNPNTVVVLFCGAPVECPWADTVKAILYMGLPGQAGGEAVKNLLYGKAVPSGKLAESWPMRYEDCPSAPYFGERDAVYREGLYVGYRHYDKAGIQPRWRFGYGLSYTRFAYSDMAVSGDTVTLTVRNTGEYAGAEVVQLYIAPPEGSPHRPVRELKRFAKVFLQPGESQTLTFTLDTRCFAVWSDGWKVPKGTYTVLAGGNPESLHVAGTVQPDGGEVSVSPLWEQLDHRPYVPQKGRFTTDDSVADMKAHSLVMKLMYWGIQRTIAKAAKPGTPEYRMMLEASASSPLRSLTISSGMKASLFRGLLAMANGNYFKGLRVLMGKG